MGIPDQCIAAAENFPGIQRLQCQHGRIQPGARGTQLTRTDGNQALLCPIKITPDAAHRRQRSR